MKPGGTCVLLVEDDRDVREVMSDCLQQEGYVLAIAANGLEALHLLEGGLRPEAILLDLLMPEMGGEAFMRWLRAEPLFCALPVIVITGVVHPSRETRSCADALLTKPFEVDDLLGMLRRVVGAARHPPPAGPPAAH